MNIIAAKAVAFHEASKASFKEICVQTLKNAAMLSAEFQRLGYAVLLGNRESYGAYRCVADARSERTTRLKYSSMLSVSR